MALLGSRLAAASISRLPVPSLPSRMSAKPSPRRGNGSAESSAIAFSKAALASFVFTRIRYAYPSTVWVLERFGSREAAFFAASSARPSSPNEAHISDSRAQARAFCGSSSTAFRRFARAPSRSNRACCAYDSAMRAVAELGSAWTAFCAASSARSLSPCTTAMIVWSASALTSLGARRSARSMSAAASSVRPTARSRCARYAKKRGSVMVCGTVAMLSNARWMSPRW